MPRKGFSKHVTCKGMKTMKKVTFLKQGIALHTAYIEGAYKIGDPVPVPLVRTALQDWQQYIGRHSSPEDDALTSTQAVWDQVRIGLHSFSATQYLHAAKQAQAHLYDGVIASLHKAHHATPRTRLMLQAPVHSAAPSFGGAAYACIYGPVINEKGEIDFSAPAPAPQPRARNEGKPGDRPARLEG